MRNEVRAWVKFLTAYLACFAFLAVQASLPEAPSSSLYPKTSDSVAQKIHSRTIRVGIGELDYPPFYFVRENKLSGAAFEIVSELARSLGHSLEIHRYPWSRIQKKLETGEIEMMILYLKSPERLKDVFYVNPPHIYEASNLIVHKPSEIAFNGNLWELRAYNFGSVRGYTHGPAFDSAGFLKKQLVNDERLLIRILVNHRVDIAVGNPQTIQMYAKETGMENQIRILEPALNVGLNHIAFSRACSDAENLANQFSRELSKFILTDRYRDILSRYGFDPHFKLSDSNSE